MSWKPPRNIIEAAEAKRSLLGGSARELANAAREMLEADIEKAAMLVRKPLPGQAPNKPLHGAEDGGSGTLDFEHFTFYGVQAWAGVFEPGSGGLRVRSEVRAADVGIVLPSGGDEVRVRFYRETLEAWAAAHVLEEAPGALMLWDGGVTPLLAGRKPWSERQAAMRELARRASQELGVEPGELAGLVASYHARKPLSVQDLLGDHGLPRPDADSHLWVSYLEYLEKLEAVRRLLQAAFRSGGTIVFVTKTSRSKSLIGGIMPDVYYLSRAEPHEPFYTEPRLRCSALDTRSLGGARAERLLPEEYRGFFAGEVAILDVYARLAQGSSILRLEMALPAREACPHAQDPGWISEEAAGMLGRIISLPLRRGYPYALLVAHREAHLPRESLARAARILGLGGERSGRSMLE